MFIIAQQGYAGQDIDVIQASTVLQPRHDRQMTCALGIDEAQAITEFMHTAREGVCYEVLADFDGTP